MKQVLILFVLASLTFGCKKKNEDPTIFEGKVVYEDDGSPATGWKVAFVSTLKSPFLTGAKPGETKRFIVGESGTFNVEFPFNDEYERFGITTGITVNGERKIINSGNGLGCSPYDCEDFKPHQNYSNLIIKVPRP